MGWLNNGDNRLCRYRTRDLETTDCAGHSQSPKIHSEGFWSPKTGHAYIGCRLITSFPPSHYILIKQPTTNHKKMIRSPWNKWSLWLILIHLDRKCAAFIARYSISLRGQLQIFCNIYSQLPSAVVHFIWIFTLLLNWMSFWFRVTYTNMHPNLRKVVMQCNAISPLPFSLSRLSAVFACWGMNQLFHINRLVPSCTLFIILCW